MIGIGKKTIITFMTFLMISVALTPMGVFGLKYPKNSNLSGVDASYLGEHGQAYAGGSVSNAGDVNGDGFDDILIGSGSYDGPDGMRQGQTYLIFGKSQGWNSNQRLNNVDASFIGENHDALAGSSVAGAGDINGDGYDDFLIGTFRGALNNQSGKAYLILGGPSGWKMDTSLAFANASFWGEKPNQMAGNYVTGVGDVNGDGFDDFMISAPNDALGPGFAWGRSYLIFGKPVGWHRDFNLSKSNASFLGENAMDMAGPIAAAGDVNGDGFDDILIGAPGYNNGTIADAGQVYLIFGKRDGWTMNLNLTNADSSFLGESQGDSAGRSIKGIGDVNSDGFDDFLVGAPNNNEGGAHAGKSYLILGRPSGWVMHTSLSTADASFRGEAANNLSGIAVSKTGDVNGDGFNDFIIGAPQDLYMGNTAGKSYLILGKQAGWAKNSNLGTVASAIFHGRGANNYSGSPLGGGGDFNGDGYDDILVGVPWEDVDGFWGSGRTYVIFPDRNSEPTSANKIQLYSNPSFLSEIKSAKVNDSIFVELTGTDADPTHSDIVQVIVNSSLSDIPGIMVRLRETGANTGKYRGNFTIKNLSKESHRWIASNCGEIITVRSQKMPGVNASLTVAGPIKIFPGVDLLKTQEDKLYLQKYWTTPYPNVTWNFQTNASWLQFITNNRTLLGLPDNSQVGSYWIKLNVTNNVGYFDEHRFNITVENTPPMILTKDVTTILEDEFYSVSYTSSDDGQGTIGWALSTNASGWLNRVPDTGEIYGTPRNKDIGSTYVNISVNDGNGGIDFSNFTLVVVNTNDPPVILTKDITSTYEDRLFSVQYNATDVDLGDVLSWMVTTSAKEWLRIDARTGLLSGTPHDEDLGQCWVNVTVFDNTRAFDSSNFTFTVLNVNDVPKIMTNDVNETTQDSTYSVVYTAFDPDKDETLLWAITTNASGWLSVNPSTGELQGIPKSSDVGIVWVNITVRDSRNGSDYHNFTLRVKNINDPPKITSTPITKAFTRLKYQYNVTAIDPDHGTNLTFSLVAKPTGLEIDKVTGIISWTPETSQVGMNKVVVRVSDGFLSDTQTFDIEVIQSNHRPVVDSIPTRKIAVGEKFTYQVKASDEDASDVLGYTLDNPPPGMTISKKGKISWTPKAAQTGDHVIKIVVTDGKENATIDFTITVTKSSQVGLSAFLLGGIVAIVITVVSIMIIFVLWRRSKGKGPSSVQSSPVLTSPIQGTVADSGPPQSGI